MDIPGYTVHGRIHEGRKSIVYTGERDSDHLSVVLKVLSGDYPSKEDRSRFQREYQLISSLNASGNRGVILAHEMQTVGHGLVAVLEDFGGVSLDRLAGEGGLDIESFMAIATAAAGGLADLHRQNVVHKNINPSNILWNPRTKELRFTGFSLASQLASENPQSMRTGDFSGNPLYISPEQTGRMNRSIDYRTDIYSLGIAFYELLAGHPPFQSDEVIELVHAHIALVPPVPENLKHEIPPAVSQIIMKMIAKNAEDRYQTAEGLLFDLRECERQEQGSTGQFVLGGQDRSSRFQIPEKLYGRTSEAARLIEIFDRVANGEAAIVMCPGEPGSGKTALVQEIYKPVVTKRGYFIQGKYEQFQQNVPYSAIGQAFGSLIRQFLAESEESLAHWRKVLLTGLGRNTQVIANVIPELNLLLGPQTPSQVLGIVETQNRFSYVFQNFLSAITSQRKPLVIFMDDLQWADSASLRLLRILTTNFGSHHMMFIGTYRADEVGPSHPLVFTLREIEQVQIAITTVDINPLTIEHIDELAADTLHCRPEQTVSLAEIILEKTQGNAFFVHQFFKSLYDEALVSFNPDRMAWEWDVDKIRGQDVTENVVALMTRRIRKLSPDTQKVLRMAACLGKTFDAQTLARVCEGDVASIVSYLWPALIQGLITPLDDRYLLIGQTDIEPFNIQSGFSFLHGRIQQAAYDLIAAPDKANVHLSIGRLLLASTPDGILELRLFDILSHLNMAAELITDPAERIRLAGLNLQAGRKAKSSTAYTAALIYFSIGRELLPAGGWETEYALTFALSVEQTQCEYLVGDIEKAKEGFDQILEKAHSALEKAEVLNLILVINISLGKLEEAIAYGRRGLSLLGLHIPATAQMTRFRLMIEYAGLQVLLFGRKIEALVKRTVITDPRELLIIELCVNVGTAALVFGAGRLYGLVTMHMMRRTLLYGNSNRSSTVYLGYALLIAVIPQDYRRAFDFGLLGLSVADSYHDSAADTKNFVLWSRINHWNRHLRSNLVYLRTAYEKGLESGDHFFATFAAYNYVITEIYLGKDLESVANTIREFLPFVQKVKNEFSTLILTLYLQYIANLQGKTKGPMSLDGGRITEDIWIKTKNHYNLVYPWYLLCKQEICYLHGDFTEALRITLEVLPLMRLQQKGHFGYPVMFMYHNLTLAGLYPTMGAKEQNKTLRTIAANHVDMKHWANLCPENYEAMYALSSAELARIKRRENEAIRFYERAIRAAHDGGYTQYEALANELAARCYEERGQVRIAVAYATEAHYLYGLWGATRKVEDLEKRYPSLAPPPGAPNGAAPARAEPGADGLDLSTIFKASQTIARDIQLKPLLTNLLKVVIENSGAVRGLLILQRQQEWFIEAELDVGKSAVKLRQSRALTPVKDIAQSLVAYVLRTQESLVLDNAASESILSRDPYVIARRPKSLLCMPILNQGKLTGALYLENSLVPGVFTTDRLELLRLLSGQIAVSIENAQLFESLRLSMDTQVKLIDKLVRAERLATIGTISAEVAHEINNPNHLVLINMSTLKSQLGWVSSVIREALADFDHENIVSESGMSIHEVLATIPGTVDDIVAASQRIASIVASLKDQAKADPAHWVQADLCDVVRDAIRFNRHIIDAATEVLLVDIPVKPVMAHVAPLRLSQVLGNLIHNSANALTDRRQSISITLKLRESPGEAWADISVSDEGGGIDAGDLSRVGEAFFSTRRQHGGSGLGLMIVKRIVNEHRGSFHIESRKGSGTTVRISLPLTFRQK